MKCPKCKTDVYVCVELPPQEYTVTFFFHKDDRFDPPSDKYFLQEGRVYHGGKNITYDLSIQGLEEEALLDDAVRITCGFCGTELYSSLSGNEPGLSVDHKPNPL